MKKSAALQRTLDSRNFAQRDFARVVRLALGGSRHVTPHDLRHTWVSRHLSAGTPIKRIQERGSWTTTKVLLDVYGHFMPTDVRGFADVITAPMVVRETHENAPQAHPRPRRQQDPGARDRDAPSAPSC